jgi:hypothetical protein
MNLKASLLLLPLFGCATFSNQPGVKGESDIDCGKVDGINVRIRADVAAFNTMSCEEARQNVDRAYGQTGTKLNRDWTVIFVGGYAGFDVDNNLQAFNPKGVTYPATLVMAVQAARPELVAHELGHAHDFDNGTHTHEHR